ncbi:hypothetical protein NEAUS04_2032 [Nematocida ausubeli]|uniref:Uncharacterized protein n=1 Tax=Nematocida ausubeli (strain ATCC PRA-371 / ERTm2) TaxID=1913371 RepID=H8ZFD3_NEMA1|nr:uncharacterized protein NESG_01936 [Nematocida ausubeli]EHY64685.1 hypothetical protein NERG_02304 [Nematocida ausubeli]KAI5132730.1 hypothetical protein NEAUS06_0326 [Nematocida ausubeli]KAI5136993.1 hypothetical protein NEAUS07_1750 [Nematocida ausubeli]KAI5146645.1 hypothetical protein NEAUS05_0090 [Nematocida ausubeli]KAI5164212.1 hypothetical protein NEAUS04_2032 [Nematocida ausubeli]
MSARKDSVEEFEEESEEYFTSRNELSTSDIPARDPEYFPYKKDTQIPSEPEITRIISIYIPEDKIKEIKALIKDVVTKKPTKNEIINRINETQISPETYNALILHIISLAKQACTKNTQSENPNSVLKLKNVLKDQFLMEIKKDLEDSGYSQRPIQQYSMFKRTPEDLSSAVSSNPQLISLFSANYNVLCCKIKKILSVKDIHNRLKKGSFEYKLSENVSLDTAKCAYAATLHYVKEIIGKCININRELDRDKLIAEMFGNVRGGYLLYKDYPTV